jgi:putative oxidoreductase
MFTQLRNTSNNKPAGILRLLLGLIFVMAGVLKVTVPHLGDAFEGQLAAADLPLRELSFIAVPILEMLIGLTLLLGWQTRLSAAVAAAIMLVATHVHLVADDPALFPLQPVEPYGPLMLLAALIYLLFRGGGAWSMDLVKKRL